MEGTHIFASAQALQQGRRDFSNEMPPISLFEKAEWRQVT